MKNHKNLVRVLLALAILFISISTIWDFTLQVQKALTRETYSTLTGVSDDYNKAFLDQISYNTKTMKVLASSLAKMPQHSQAQITSFLQDAVDEGGFTEIVIADAAGNSCSNQGIIGNIAQREFFQIAMRGEANVSQPFIPASSGEKSIVIAVPINGQAAPIGVIFGVYPLSTAASQLLNFTYYSEGYGFIVAPDGTIILASEHTDKLANEANLLNFFSKVDFIDFSLDQLKTAMQNGETSSFTFTYNGQRRFVSCTPSQVNDWYTFSMSSDAMMREQEKIATTILATLLLRLLLIALLVFTWIMLRHRRYNQEILTASQKYQSLLAHINGGMIVAAHALKAEETIVSYVSPGFTTMTGYTLTDIQEMYGGQYLDVITEEDRQTVFDIYLQQLALGNTYYMPYRIRKKDGSLLWVMDNGYLVKDEDGLHNHSIITDISTLKQQEEELRLSEKRFSVAINSSSGTLFEVDLKQQLYTHFENSERIFGVAADELLAATNVFSTLPFDQYVEAITTYFFHPDDYNVAKESMADVQQNGKTSYEARLRRFDNSYIWTQIDLSLSLDELGRPDCLIGFISDIDAIKTQAEMLENQVQTDQMTGLYNKIALNTLAHKVLTEYPDNRHALIVIDIDNFKGINDTLGHAFGDLVLIEFCNKLKNAFRTNDIVGRMGGDEFAILMKNVPDTSSVLKKATKLAQLFRQTYVGEKEIYEISCSMGILMIENNQESFEMLFRKADAALYQAKQQGRNQFVLYQEQDAENYPIESCRTNDEELHNLQAPNHIESQIFELLYTSKDFHVSINMALAVIGQQYHVSRVAIFENDAQNLTTSNIYEWCNEGITPKIDQLQKIKLTADTDSIMDCFDRNGLLYCNDIMELPPYVRQLLELKGTLSTLKVTITNDEHTCGFIGFDDCKEHRIWTTEEIDKLSFLSKVLSVFLFKKKTEQTLLDNLHTRLQILDILPDYICVINPETHTLEYTNNKMQELLPQAQPGAFCFTTMRGGQQAPCETCLLERIKKGDMDNLKIISSDKSLELPVKALTINWSNDQKMVLLYGTVQDLKNT